jgi:L-lactate dehydrogenase complex protein LldE
MRASLFINCYNDTLYPETGRAVVRGTFSVKNAEVSSAMLAVKLQYVIATGAEYCTALDNSCLMRLGGAMHREYVGMKTIHLAQILASTEDCPAEATL